MRIIMKMILMLLVLQMGNDNVDGSYELDDLDNIDNKNYEDRIEDALV